MNKLDSKRDEKSLALSHRTMLRLLVELNDITIAREKLGLERSLDEMVVQDVFLGHISDLMTLATELAKKLGSPIEVKEYLNKHAIEDAKYYAEKDKSSKPEDEVGSFLSEVMSKLPSEIMSKLSKKCTDCGDPICPGCNECHACASGEQKILN